MSSRQSRRRRSPHASRRSPKLAGATDADRLGEQLALLYDGAAARSVAVNTLATADTAREIAAMLIDRALPGESP
jgi:hypothetical protein